MQRLFILLFCVIPFVGRAQHDVLALEKNNMHVRSYTIGDNFTFETVYGQWFNGTIDDLHHDTIYISGQAFSYKEVAAVAREKNTGITGKGTGVAAIVVGTGVFVLGAFNGAYRGDKASTWYTTSGIVLGSGLIATGIALVASAKKYYKLGGKFKLQYMQIGR